MELIENIKEIWDEYYPAIIAIGCGFGMASMIIIGAIVAENKWDNFSAQHNCRIVGKRSGDIQTTVAPIIGGNGGIAIGVSTTTEKTAYACDDGITYWR
jgi:hypothetical protein